jgi:hypothetical protein
MNVGTKELLGLSKIVEDTIESLNISAEEKEIMYDFIFIEKNNRDKASKFYKDKYQERIKEFTEKEK